MGRKLTRQELEEREVQRIVKKIIGLEKHHEQRLVEKACWRYKNANLDKRRTEDKIQTLEKELSNAKGRLA